MGTIDAIIGMDLQRSRYRGIICASEVCPNIANCAFRLLFRLRGHDYTNELKSSDRIDFSPRFPSSSRDINSSLFHEWRKEDEEVIPLNWSHKHYVVSYIPLSRTIVVILSWYCRDTIVNACLAFRIVNLNRFGSVSSVLRIAWSRVCDRANTRSHVAENQHGFYFAYIRICTVLDTNIIYTSICTRDVYLFLIPQSASNVSTYKNLLY